MPPATSADDTTSPLMLARHDRQAPTRHWPPATRLRRPSGAAWGVHQDHRSYLSLKDARVGGDSQPSESWALARGPPPGALMGRRGAGRSAGPASRTNRCSGTIGYSPACCPPGWSYLVRRWMNVPAQATTATDALYASARAWVSRPRQSRTLLSCSVAPGRWWQGCPNGRNGYAVLTAPLPRS